MENMCFVDWKFDIYKKVLNEATLLGIMKMSNTYLNKTHMLFATIVINGGTIWKVKVNRIQIHSLQSVFLFEI